MAPPENQQATLPLGDPKVAIGWNVAETRITASCDDGVGAGDADGEGEGEELGTADAAVGVGAADAAACGVLLPVHALTSEPVTSTASAYRTPLMRGG
jgi:hypothetical protein